MATVYTDALYSTTNMGIVGGDTSYFTLSAANNTLVLAVAGQLNGSPVIGVAYNDADWSAASAAAARRTLTINTYSSGVSSGINSLLTTSVSSVGGLSFALLLANHYAINLTYSGSTLTYAADLSAATLDVSDKNDRRLHLLGIY